MDFTRPTRGSRAQEANASSVIGVNPSMRIAAKAAFGSGLVSADQASDLVG